ncbi:MAG: hypothetical protein JW837_04110 [Sedimentisphaerales bacterium]|nr:hypothetical protein [Sedimentisphaerales bacterium]
MISSSGFSVGGNTTSVTERPNNQSKFYNLARGLSEKNNLIVKHPEIVKSLEDKPAVKEQHVLRRCQTKCEQLALKLRKQFGKREQPELY